MSLNNMERKEIKNRTLAMSRDEQELTVRFIPMDILQSELERRNEAANNKLDAIYIALAKSQNRADLQGIISTLGELREILAIGGQYECIQ